MSMKNLLLLDCANLAYRSVFAAITTDPDDNLYFSFWKHLFFNSFLQTISQINPDRVIVCQESPDNWRYDYYKDYKIGRAARRLNSKINFDKFFPVMNSFLDDIQKTFTNIIFLKVDRAEADDIISTVCLRELDTQKVIVSSDKDFTQLINNVTHQYDAFKKSYVECLNPIREREIKVISGDRSDSIPPIKSRCGPVTASKLLSEGLQDLLASDEEVRKNYDRNRILIDFNCIPSQYSDDIWQSYQNYPVKEIKVGTIFNFLIKHNLQKIAEDWNSYDDKIKSLR